MTYQIKGHATMCYSGGGGQDHVLWIDYSLSSVAMNAYFLPRENIFSLKDTTIFCLSVLQNIHFYPGVGKVIHFQV